MIAMVQGLGLTGQPLALVAAVLDFASAAEFILAATKWTSNCLYRSLLP